MVRPRCGSRVHSLPLCQYSVHMRRKQQHLSASLMIRLLGASFFLPLNQGCSKQVSKLLSGPAQYSATAPTMRWKREAFKMRNLLNGWSCRKVMEAVVFFLCDREWLRIKKRRRRCVACFFFPWGGGKVFSAGIFPLMHSEYRKFSKCRKRRRLEPRLDS